MKKIGSFLILANLIIVTCVALLFIDNYSYKMTLEAHYSETINYRITFNDYSQDDMNISNVIDKIALLSDVYKYNVYAVDVISEKETNIYVLTTDERYIARLPISDKTLFTDPTSQFNSGSSIPIEGLITSSKNKISIIHFNKIRSITDASIIINFSDSSNIIDINNIEDELSPYGITLHEIEPYNSSSVNEYFKYANYVFVFFTLTILAAIVSVLKSSKTIGLYKAEGYSDASIFKEMVLGNKIKYTTLVSCLIILILYIYFRKFGLIGNIWLLVSYIPFIILTTLSLAIVFVVILSISKQPIALLVKKKVEADFIIRFITFGKIFILVPLIVSSLNMVSFYKDYIVYEDKLKQLNSLYDNMYYVKYYNGSYESDFLSNYDLQMFNLLDTNIKYSLNILDSQNENIPYFVYISESYFKVSDINISHEITLTARENTIAESELINILSEFSPWTSEVKQVDQSLFDLIFVNKTSHYINSSNILYLHMEPSFLSANFSYDCICQLNNSPRINRKVDHFNL